MPDKKISALTDGVAAVATDRIPVARSPYAPGDNYYLTPADILDYVEVPIAGYADAAEASATAAAASAAAADASADETDADRVQTGLDRTQTGVDRAAAETARSAAELARDQAEAYALSASVDEWYLTEGDMQADLAGHSNGDVAGVWADETSGNKITFYMKSGGVWVGPYPLNPAAKTVYYDPVTGNHAYSGLEPEYPKPTFAAAHALMLPGDTLRTAASSETRGALATTIPFTTFDRYGVGEDPVYAQDRPIAAGAWTAHATPGVWYADVTHQQITSNPGAGDANACWFQMWATWEHDREAECLQPYWAGADIAANIAYIAANPGLFTCHKQGSTQKNPQADGASTLYRYYVFPPNGEDPSAGDLEYSYAEQLQIASLFEGCSARNMIWQRTATKDGAGHNTHYADTLEHIKILDVPIHGWVGAAMRILDGYARCSPMLGSHTNRGGGWHIFGAAPGAAARIERTRADGFGASFFTHSPGGGADSNRKATLRNIESRDAGKAINFDGSIDLGAHIDGLKSINDENFVSLPQGSVVKNASFLSKTGSFDAVGIGYNGVDGGKIGFDNISLVFRNTGSRVLSRNEEASNTADSGHLCTIEFRNLTNVGGGFSGSVYFKQVDYKCYDSILGYITGDYSATLPWNSLVADNCQLAMWARTLEEIQALAPGVESNCVVPWVAQPYERTVIEADLAYVALAARAVNGSSGNDTLTAVTTQDFAVVGGQIKIPNAYGDAVDRFFRVIEVISTGSGGQFRVDPTPSNTISNKQPHRAIWGRKLFPTGSTGLTAVFSNDGMQAYLSADSPLISEGMTIYFGAIGRRAPIGPRKITAKSGQTLTLDRAVDWITPHNGTYITYATFGVANGATRPSVALSFGFPLRGAQSGVTGWGAAYANDYALPVATATRTGEEGTGTGGLARFTNNTGDYLADGSSGTVDQIKREIGEVDAGFNPIGVGDVLSVDAVAYVEDYEPIWAGDPQASGFAVPAAGSLIAALGIGACHVALP